MTDNPQQPKGPSVLDAYYKKQQQAGTQNVLQDLPADIQANPQGVYNPGQDMGPLRYSQNEINYWQGEMAKTGETIDPDWLQRQQEQNFAYHMSSPVNPTQYYWESSQNVGRWAALVDNLPDNVAPPAWLDVDTVRSAAKYFSDLNGGKPWYEWADVSPTDPARISLRQMQSPDPQDLPNWEVFTSKQNEAIQKLSQEPLPAPNSAGFAGDYKPDLPWWQYPLIAATSQAGGMAQGAVGGAMVGGSFAGPAGAAIGAAGGAVTSYLASEEAKKATDPNYQTPFWVQALNALDWAASQVERGVGVAEQFANDPAAVLANLESAWNAGQFAYNVTDPFNAGELNTRLMDVLAGTPLGGAIQANRALNKGKTAQTEVWELGQAQASDIWKAPDGKAPSDYALTTIRNNLANGTWNTDQAAQFVYSKFGVTGETRDMLGHMFLDPLNISGVEVSKGIQLANKAAVALGKGGEAAKLASEAFGSGRNLLDDVRMYTQGARTRISVEEAATLPTFTKMIAGISDTGMLKDHLDPAASKNAIEKFFGPNRYSRAVQMTQQSFDGLSRLLELEPGADGKVNLLKQLIGATPEQVVKAGGEVGKITLDIGGEKVETEIPKYWQSPEGQGVLSALKSAGPEVDALAEQMRTALPKRGLLEDVAKYHPDYVGKDARALITDLEKADAKGKAVILERWKQGLSQVVGQDAAAKEYFTLITQGKIGVKQLDDAVRPFKNGAPFRDEEFTLALMDAVTNKVEKFSADYFGVKPDPALYRMSGIIKKAQSYLVLGYNPTYLANNAISNLVHLAYDGLLGSSKLIGQDEVIKALYGDNVPMRMREGLGAGEIGGTESGGAIRDAAKGGGAIGKLEDLLTPKSKALKTALAPFAAASAQVEGWASKVAFTHGVREYWGNMWQAGKGFDNVRAFDPQLADMLDAMVPGGTKKVEAMIRRGRNRAEIEAELFKGFESKSLDDVITPEDQNMVNAFPDVFDALKKEYDAAATDGEKAAALMRAQQGFARKVSEEMSNQTARAVREMIAKVQIDGPAQGIPEKLGDILQDYNEFWSKYQDDLGDMWQEADTLPAGERQPFIDSHMEKFRVAWDTYETRHAADWMGMAQALGGGENAPAEWLPILDIRAERAKEWSTFFLEREDNYRQARARSDELKASGDDIGASAAWDDYFRKQNENYSEMVAWEHIINRLFQTMTTEQVQAKQPQFLDGYRTWIDSQHSIRLQMMASEELYRRGSLTVRDPAGMADRFLSQHPELAEKWGAVIHAAADEVTNAKVPAEVAAKIYELTHGRPEYQLDSPTKKTAKEEFAKVRAEYVKQLLNAKNTAPDVQPKVKPPAPEPPKGAKPATPSIYDTSRTLTPIYDAFEAAAKEVGEPEGYFSSKKSGMLLASHIAAAIDEQLPGMGRKLTQLTDEQLQQAIEGWKQKHIEKKAKYDAAQAQTNPAAETPAGPAPVTKPEPPAAPVDYEAAQRARVVQTERETSYKLADATGEFQYGRKDLETALRATLPDQADDLLAVFDSLAENFNPELSAKEFYERLGWKMGGTFEDGAGLKQITPEQARMIDIPVEIPDIPEFRRAIADIPGAQITDEGLLIKLVRSQRPEQAGEMSVRTGVFYLASGDKNIKYYRSTTSAYGGVDKYEGETLIKHPYVTKGATGGKVPEAAYDAIKGKGAYEAMRTEAIQASQLFSWVRTGNARQTTIDNIYNFLKKYNGDADQYMAEYIMQNSQAGNLLPYALQENVVAHALREAGYDSIIGYSKKRNGENFISEVFDLREATYPARGVDSEIVPFFQDRMLTQSNATTNGLTNFTADLKATISAFNTADISTFAHELIHGITPVMKQEDADIVRAEFGRTHPQSAPLPENWHTAMVDAGGGKQTAQHVEAYEWLSRSFERFLVDGKAPTSKLRDVFKRIKGWMLEIYGKIKGSEIDQPVSDAVNQLFKKWMGGKEEAPAPQRPAMLQQDKPLYPIAAQAGTADGLTEPPIDKAMLETYLQHIDPMVEKWRKSTTGQTGHVARMAIGDLPKQAQTGIRRYLGKVYGQMNDVKMGATRWGEGKRDFALLNYSKRSDADSLLSAVAPYQFWYTHSMMNWGLRALEKPSIITNYLRLQQFANQQQNREGYPTRLKGKMSIPAPWLPDWAGNEIFVDANKQLFPFLTFTRPFEKAADQNNMVERRAMSSIDYAQENGQISASEADQARTKQGSLWEKYYTAAELDVRGDSESSLGAPVQPGSSRNAMDLAFSVLSPSLPLSMAYAALTGRKDTVGLLPLTKFVKTTTGALGVNGGQGVNIEAPIRQALGWPEQDRYADYRVDAAMAQLMADGEVSADQAKQAMIDRSGPAYQKALQRVSQIEPLRYIGAPLGADIFPEGEREVRALKDEYDTARTQWVAGDKQALSDFYEKYPEYDVRNFSFKEPEERTRSYLISSIWEAYNGLNSAERKAVGKDNDLFQTAFVNKDTRSYDSIDTATLTAWAQRMQAKTPAKVGKATAQAPLVDAKVNPGLDAYDAEKKAKFPNLSALEGMAAGLEFNSPQYKAFRKQHPELAQYTAWKNDYLAQHPEITPYVTSEESKVYGLPSDVQGLYYRYQSNLQHLFPGIFDKKDAYYSISDKDQRKAYLNSHPELSNYWDWRKKYAADNPKVSPYILSAETLANAINPGGGYGGGSGYSTTRTANIPADIKRTVLEHAQAGTVPLAYGIESETAKLKAKMKMGEMDDETFWKRMLPGMQTQPQEEHPAVLSQDEIAQLPNELVRQLVAHKYADVKLGSGAEEQLAWYKDKFGIPKRITVDQFAAEYVLPALQ